MRICIRKMELLQARQGMSATELAEKSGVSRQSISTIRLRGTCLPATLAKLAKGLGVDPADLIEEADGE